MSIVFDEKILRAISGINLKVYLLLQRDGTGVVKTERQGPGCWDVEWNPGD